MSTITVHLLACVVYGLIDSQRRTMVYLLVIERSLFGRITFDPMFEQLVHCLLATLQER